jgi:hypothetical protein
MYPHRELIQLAAHKAALQHRISSHRTQCVGAATRIVRPIEWIDGILAFIRRISPLARLATLPLGVLLHHAAGPRLQHWGVLLKWAPLLFGALRGLAPRSEPTSSHPLSSRAPADTLSHAVTSQKE